MTITIKEYFAEAGSRLSNADARAIGPVLQELTKQDGELSPSQIVQAAHSTNSPLHDFFEWDDRNAASHYRDGQAKEIMQAVRVRYTANGREFASRAYKVLQIPYAAITPRLHGASVVRLREPETYQPNEARVPAISATGDLDTIVSMAIRDLEAWRVKYQRAAESLVTFGAAIQIILNQLSELREEYVAGGLSGKFKLMLEDLSDWKKSHIDSTKSAPKAGTHFAYLLEALDDAESEMKVLVAHGQGIV